MIRKLISTALIYIILHGSQGCDLSFIYLLGYRQQIVSVAPFLDDDRLSFIYDNGSPSLYTVNADGTNLTKILDFPIPNAIENSPNKVRLDPSEYFCQILRKREIEVFPGPREKRLRVDRAGDFLALINGTLLAYESSGSLQWWASGDQVAQDCYSPSPPLYTPNDYAFTSFDISPDGTTIVFAEGWLLDLKTRKLVDYLARLYDVSPILPTLSAPVWSPDGKSIAVPFQGVSIIDREDESVRQVPIPNGWGLAGGIDWSMKTDTLVGVFDFVDGNRTLQLATFKPDGADFRVYDEPTWAANPVFSPDGEKVFFTNEDPVTESLYSLELTTGKVDLIVDAKRLPLNTDERVYRP